MKRIFLAIIVAVIGCTMLTSCMKSMGGQGGEVTGVRGRSWNEPQPYGMVLVKRGSMEVGAQSQDSLWGDLLDAKGISNKGYFLKKQAGTEDPAD